MTILTKIFEILSPDVCGLILNEDTNMLLKVKITEHETKIDKKQRSLSKLY
jgi:hypothetical protein